MSSIDVPVLVKIDTSGINDNNLQTKVVLSDNQDGDGDKTPGDSRTFTINVAPGDTVTFSIAKKDSTDLDVSFVSFQVKVTDPAQTNLFSSVPSSANNWVGTVGSAEGDESFTITFSVATSPIPTQYTLDPELHVQKRPG